ncbi:MAG: hypothetical protein KGM42_16950 [Hyphomicrobiales bacterium]|nr:hypothetical protein [Hyphomicrobiales bacterium]
MTARTMDDEAAIEAVLREYADLTNARDCTGVASRSYRTPVLLVDGNGGHTAFPDRAALEAGFEAYLEGEEKAGWVSSSISKMELRLVSKTVALAYVDYHKTQKHGHAADGWIYIFQKHAGVWRIVCVAARDV